MTDPTKINCPFCKGEMQVTLESGKTFFVPCPHCGKTVSGGSGYYITQTYPGFYRLSQSSDGINGGAGEYPGAYGGPGASNVVMGAGDEIADRIIAYLERCGNADIEAGVGQIFGFGAKPGRSAFREAIKAALPALEIRIEIEGSGGGPIGSGGTGKLAED